MDRYGMASMVGIGILFSFCLFYRARGDVEQGGVTVAIFLVSVLFRAGIAVASPDSPAQNLGVNLATIRPDLPIVVSNPLTFLELDHNEVPAVVARLYFLTDRSSAVRYTGTDAFDRGYPLVRKWFPIRGRIQDYYDFLHHNKSFLIYGTYSLSIDWSIRRLLDDNVGLRFLGQTDSLHGPLMLLEVAGE
jgi:hypothetical protein